MRKKPSLPPGCEVANGRIVYRPYVRKADRGDGVAVDTKGRLAPPIKLGKVGDDYDFIVRVYQRVKAGLEKEKAAKLHTLDWIMREYMKSREYRNLAPNTRRVNDKLLTILEHPLEIDGKPDTLANLHILDVSKPLFHQIKEKRYSDRLAKGQKGAVMTNREISLISTSISWAVNFVPGLGIHRNPLLRFKKLKEHANTRYVTDDEYQQQYAIAAESENSILPLVFELTYLTATRGIESINIKVSDCTSEGIAIRRTKGSKDNIILWSDRLRAAYDAALLHHQSHKILPIDPPLLLNSEGQHITRSALNSAMQRLKQKMDARGLNHVYWNLHLLKSKGVSDAEDSRIAGHKSEAMRQRYNTKIEAHKPAG